MKPPLPDNEAQRLALLERLQILDTPRDPRFDALTELAMMICGTPAGLITLIERDRQWFKSCIGMEGEQTERDLAFCAYALLQPEDLLVVEDARLDPRFADHPAVTGEPHIRFYAGMPLQIAPGMALGTLCVVDYQPRQLEPAQLKALRLLGRQVVELLQLHQRNLQVQHQAERFATLSNSIPLLIGQLDQELRYEFSNYLYRDWFGLEPAAMLGKTPLEVFGPAYLEGGWPLIKRALQGQSAQLERPLRDGRTVEISFSPVYSGSHINGVFITGVDISERKRHERVLERERQNLDLVIRGANLGSWQWHVPSGEVVINERWAQMLGYSLADLAPMTVDTWRQLLHPDDTAAAEQTLQRHFNEASDFYEQRFRMRCKDGSWRWVYSCGRVFSRTADGSPERMFGTQADITAAEEARRLLEQNEQKLSSLYQLSPVAIALNRLSDGAFIEANPEFYHLLGYSPEEFAGKSYWDITPPEYQAAELEQLEAIHVSGRYGPYEKHYIHRDGSRVPVLLNGVAIDTGDGQTLIWSIIQDITERKRIEQLKNDFVSAVSHELRTPLTSIAGALSLVNSGLLGALSPKAQEMLDIAQKNAQRLSHLIDDLLDMDKLAAGKLDFHLHNQWLLPIVEQSITAIRAYASSYQVDIVLHNQAGALMVNVDAQRLQQVMANFLSNAIKFSPPEGQVEVFVRCTGAVAEVRVQDHGPGISEAFRAQIFKKFSQADASSSRQRGGTGLGLAISKQLVERMGGEIGFDSVPGQGADFFVRFPVVVMGSHHRVKE